MKITSIAWKIGEIVIGIIVGIVVEETATGPDKITLAIMCGLLTTILLDTLHNHVESIHLMESLDETLRLLAKAIGQRGAENQLLVEALRYSNCKIKQDQMPLVWKDLSLSMRNNYRATNYMDAEAIYGRGFADSVKIIQEAKKTAQNITVRKVFIVDQIDELKSEIFKKLIMHHKNCGFDIRYITKQKLNQLGDLSAQQKHLDSIDFGIFDDEIVLIWKVDLNSRKFTGGEVRVGRAECQPFVDFFEALQQEARTDFEAL